VSFRSVHPIYNYFNLTNPIEDSLRKHDLIASSSVTEADAPLRDAGLRRAKIICTVGPACDSEAALRDLMRMGMDVARLNFSTDRTPNTPATLSGCGGLRKKKGARFASCKTFRDRKSAPGG
jgi:hypothetical protein